MLWPVRPCSSSSISHETHDCERSLLTPLLMHVVVVESMLGRDVRYEVSPLTFRDRLPAEQHAGPALLRDTETLLAQELERLLCLCNAKHSSSSIAPRQANCGGSTTDVKEERMASLSRFALPEA